MKTSPPQGPERASCDDCVPPAGDQRGVLRGGRGGNCRARGGAARGGGQIEPPGGRAGIRPAGACPQSAPCGGHGEQ
eukprot:4346020-Pyramimonas_sp.AAC.1